MAQPTAAEVQDGAGRVEAYSCSVCQQVTRFPRYTKPAKLLETRRGRCGEWAHTFLLVLRAVGLDARHVTDNADHVWCEYYSLALGRWVHVDPCEEAWDTPLLYEGGWGKSLAYVFGCSKHGAMDITRRYVLQPQALPALRSQVPEAWLAATLARLNSPLRAAMDTNARREAALREAAEALQLMSFEDDGSGAAAVAAANLPARQSGAQAWRSARGETGGEVTAQSRSAGHATSYQRAHDDALPPLFAAAGRITGGACRASGEHRGGQPSQQALRAFDGSLSSKWLDFGGGGSDGAAWLEYQLLPRQDAVILSHYDMVVAEDCPERDPRDWVLECIPERPNADTSSSGSSSNLDAGWVVLDQRCGEHFHRRHQLRSFLVPEAARIASRQWRLRITCAANPSTANSVQVACLNLYSSIVALRVLHGQREQQQWHMQSSSLPQPQGMPLCLLYFSLDHWCNITRLLACGAAASDGDRASASELHDSVLDTECGVVQRIINNMFEYPNNAKFWQLGTRGSKIQPVLRHPSMLALLLQVGFRPMMDLSPEVSVTEQHVRLVADGSSRENIALLRALKE
ncbi:hypothetical protein COO60DRAFT_115705 [Scenedesmus sp. NREL 46B-D3]|nr:hypothetical protein COO60DRAFT_115705 [Scenedesmus sp. NREL 46B-D3]